MSEETQHRDTDATTAQPTSDRAKPATQNAWPLPAIRDPEPRVSPGLQISAFAANPSLGMAALGLGAGAFGRRYRTSVE
jgi:hypothetical protein